MIRHGDNEARILENLTARSNFGVTYSAYKLECTKQSKQATSAKPCPFNNELLKSKAARLLAIRQVTQLNAGKKTARHFCSSGILPKDASGIDGKKSLTFEERFELEELLKASSNDWKHHSLRSIPIPKKDGSTRMLKIPTIADRAWQCRAKYALEPACALQLFMLKAMVSDLESRHMMPKKSFK